MGDTLLPDDDDESDHRSFPFSSRSRFFNNSSGGVRDTILSLMTVLHIIRENFAAVPARKKYPPAFSIGAHPKGGLVLS
jgi:hypothetical protein